MRRFVAAACLGLMVLLGAAWVQVTTDQGLWGLDRIDQRLGLDQRYNYLATGAGVNIFIVGTGVYRDHDDFKDDSMPPLSRVTYVGDFCDPNLNLMGVARVGQPDMEEVDPGDGWDGHETHVASYAAGKFSGVAKHAHIYSLRTTWDTTRDSARDNNNGGAACADGSARVAAFNWIARRPELRPAVVNYSGGGGPTNVQDAIYNLVVTLSGNTGGLVTTNWGSDVPDKALVVGGTCMWASSTVRPVCGGADYALNSSTRDSDHYGSSLALYAPAEGLKGASKSAHDRYDIPEDFARYAGDSFAAPFVAGAAALYLESHRTASWTEVRQAIINSATSNVVRQPGGETAPNRLLHLPTG
jgi:subtilisin family serine protease